MPTAVSPPPSTPDRGPAEAPPSDRREAELQQQVAELREFAYMAAHDLAEPLRTVSGYVQLLARRRAARLDPQASEWLRMAVEGAARMQDLLEGALAACQAPDRDARRLSPSADAVAAALANLRRMIEQRRAVVRCGNLPAVLAEPALLTRLFQNLIANAIRHNPGAAPEISIEGEERAWDWLFRVADNGPGIAGAVPGLGLQICARIVERHGGRLWTARARGGAVVCFTLAKS